MLEGGGGQTAKNQLPQIRRIIQSGEIPAVKVGREWDFSKQYFHDAGFMVTE